RRYLPPAPRRSRTMFTRAALILLALAPLARAQPPMMGGKGGGMPGAEVTWYPSQRVAGQAGGLSLSQERASAAFPLWKDGETMLLGNASVGHWGLGTDAVLPRSATAFPSDLWNVSLGLTAMHKFENGWTFGGGVSGGSASDRPFGGIDELNANVNAFLRVPWGERDSWMFGLMYSPLGQLPFPVPMVSYAWNPSEAFSMNLGLPLSVKWRPAEDVTLEASYMILTNVRARATWGPDGGLQLYTGFDWTNQGHHLYGRPQDERFFYEEKRLSAGARVGAAEGFTLDVSAGYAFDRIFREGDGFGGAGGSRVEVGAGPFVAGRLSLRW
ncbi:MAG: DUF6268 family outer membrane beta-barrel protein, partial [Gemmataceae bacterium]